jgi:uncharacterized membrane protein
MLTAMIIENVNTINAPPAEVWRVTEDIERWPTWTPTVTKVTRLDDGPFDVGSAAKIKQPGLPECEWKVTACTGNSAFTWQTRVFTISMSATHELSPTDSGTQCTLRIQLQGPLATLLRPLIRSSIKNTLERENAALKLHCESSKPSSTVADAL